MRSLLFSLIGGFLGLLIVPFAALAANDVTLTQGQAVLSVNGASLNITGSDATINSIVVNSATFVVTMSGTSTMKVSAPGLQKLTVTSHTMDTVCNGSESSLNIGNPSADTATDVTVSVSTDTCGTTNSSGGSTSSGGGTVVGLIGKVNDEIIGRPQIIYPDGTVVYLDEQGSQPQQSTSVPGSPLNVPSPTPGALPSSPSVSALFSKTLRPAMIHADILRLQQLLNSDPDTWVAETGVGSPGRETTYYGSLTTSAVQRFQAKHGVVLSGSPATTGYGLVGPATRAKLNEVFGGGYSPGAIQSVPSASTLPSLPSITARFDRGLAVGDTGHDVRELQVLLNLYSDTQITTTGVGSPGNETNYFGAMTKAAVAKFQMKHGIVGSPGDVGYGYVGPQTRAKLNELATESSRPNGPQSAAPASSAVVVVSSTQEGARADLTRRIQNLLDSVKVLQGQIAARTADQSSSATVSEQPALTAPDQTDTYSWNNLGAVSAALNDIDDRDEDVVEIADNSTESQTGTYKWNNLDQLGY